MRGTRWPAVGAIGWALLLLVTLAGCASYKAPGSTPFIVKKGSGPVDVGSAVKTPMKVNRAAIERASRAAITERAAVPKPEGPPSIERLDPELREALASLGKQASPHAHVVVGQQYWRLGVYDAAYDHFSDAIRLDPKNVAAWEGRARVFRDWHLPGPALSDVYRAKFYGRDRPEILNTLGTILEQVGQCGAARDAYASALRRDPAATWARDNLVRLEGRADTCGG